MIKKTFTSLFSFSSMQASTALKRGTQVFSQYGIKVLFTPEEHCRPGTTGKVLIITPKSCGNAPQRNHARRRIKAFVYEQQLAHEKGVYSLIVYSQFHDYSVAKLQTILKKALQP